MEYLSPRRPGFLLLVMLHFLPSLFIIFATIPSAASKQSRLPATVLYEFKRSHCLQGSIPDSIPTSRMGSLTLNSTSLCLSTGNGLGNSYRMPTTGNRARSSTMGSLSTSFATNSFWSADFWVKLTGSTSSKTTMLTFTDTTTTSRVLALAQNAGKVSLQSYNNAEYPTNGFSAYTSTPAFLHVAVTQQCTFTSDDDTTDCSLFYKTFYFNGAYHGDLTLDGTWTTNTRLNLFSPPTGFTSTQAWTTGEIHLIGLYNRTLSAAEVLRNYAAGLPNSVPVSTNVTTTVQENGEVGTHYNDPSFYLSPVPVLQLANLTLAASDADCDPISPNYNTSAAPLRVYVASLPSKGTLYHLNGTAITTTPARLSSTGDCGSGDRWCRVRFRPAWGEVSWPSVYTTFTYYAVDGVTGTRSATATFFVKVKQGHQPPKPKNVSVEAKAGRLQIITLNGTASDGAGIASASITSLPQHGNLYQVYANLTVASGGQAGGRITSTGTSMWTLRVAYLYTGRQNITTATGGRLLNTDIFGFIVTDGRKYVSRSGKASVNVTSSLKAVASSSSSSPSTKPIALQGRASAIIMYGYDYQSLSYRTLCAQITSLPFHGTLHRTSTSTTAMLANDIITNQVMTYPYTMGVRVYYKSDASFFTSPNSTYDGALLTNTESFGFRVVDCNSTRVISTTTRQPITVVNVNKATSLDWAKTPYRLTSSSTFSQTWTLQDITITDPDQGVDPVKTYINANSKLCKVALNADALTSATVIAKNSKAVILSSTPSVLSRLLNGATLTCSKGSPVANLTITVYDGLGGPCLTTSSFHTYTNRSTGCLVSTRSIAIPTPDTASTKTTGLILIIVIAVGGSTAFLCLLCMLTFAIRRWRASRMGGYQSQNTPTAKSAAAAVAVPMSGERGSKPTTPGSSRAFFPDSATEASGAGGGASDSRGGSGAQAGGSGGADPADVQFSVVF